MIVGVKAPDFTLYDHKGRLRSLSGFLADGPVVLFFFPLASSPICTAQACHFRDLGEEFAALGVQRLGVSTDSVDRQARFAARRSFDYPLLSDVGGVMSDQFGVRRGVLASARTAMLRRWAGRGGRHLRRRGLLARVLPLRRTTFVIDTDRTVLTVIRSELRASAHADLALRFLREKYPDRSTSHPAPEPEHGSGAPEPVAAPLAEPDAQELPVAATEHIEPSAVEPEPATPEPAQLQPVESELVAPGHTGSESVEPAAAEREAPEPGRAEPEAVVPEAAEPEGAELEGAELEGAELEGAEPEGAEPESAEAEREPMTDEPDEAGSDGERTAVPEQRQPTEQDEVRSSTG